jgi:hypothetical protein
VELKFIDEELKALNLKAIPINALHPDDKAYTILLNQHKGKLTATNKFIGNSDDTLDLSVDKFLDFAKVVFKKGYDLAISPEYSCPWKALNSIIASKTLPSPGKLWILGMESITPKELIDFINAHGNTNWIYDSDLVKGDHQKIFLDPVCLFFKALNQGGQEVDVCVLQFKNQHMSVHNDVYREEDYLIEGRFIYVLRNEGNTINLLTMICSDSLKYDNACLLKKNLDKLLMVHIQMNLDPRHHIFKDYRNTIFNGESSNIEILCLNWAKGSKILNTPISYSGTSYFLKSEKPILEDKRLNANQDCGLFYSYWTNKRCHAFFFASDDYLIGFSTSKTSQALAAPPLRRREGPESSETYQWVENQYKVLKPLPDSFMIHCATLQCDLSPLDKLSHVDKERLIRLSNGLNLTKKWFDVLSFDFFGIDDSEIINRITFTDEPNSGTQTTRDKYLMNLKELVVIFNQHKKAFPPSLVTLTSDTKIHYDVKINPLINVYSVQGDKPLGTITYLGSSVENLAQREYDNLDELYRSHPLGDRNREKPRIIIWYNDNGIKKYFKDNVSIDADLDESGISISKDASR